MLSLVMEPTEKKVVRIMMPTCGARMQSNDLRSVRNKGLTLIELLLATVLLLLFVGMAAPNLFGLLRKNTFRSGIRDFVSTMEKAVTAAAESDRRYEVIIDIDEQTYLLRQITSSDLSQVLDEEVIIDNNFSEKCFDYLCGSCFLVSCFRMLMDIVTDKGDFFCDFFSKFFYMVVHTISLV